MGINVCYCSHPDRKTEITKTSYPINRKQKIIEINEGKCDGCGLCADACHENAIGVVNGKAKLLRDDYCDGLGNCLPVCPAGAITFVEREAKEYDGEAVRMNREGKARPGVCPGSNAHSISRPAGDAGKLPFGVHAREDHPHRLP